MGLLKTWLKICGKWTQFTEQQSRPMYYHQHHRWWWWCWCCYCWWCLEPGLSSANWWSNCKIEAPFLFMWSDNSTSICIGGRVLHRNTPNSIELFDTPQKNWRKREHTKMACEEEFLHNTEDKNHKLFMWIFPKCISFEYNRNSISCLTRITFLVWFDTVNAIWQRENSVDTSVCREWNMVKNKSTVVSRGIDNGDNAEL